MSDETTDKPNGKPKRSHNPQNYPVWWENGIPLRSIASALGLHRSVVERLIRESGIEGVLSSDGQYRRYPPNTIEVIRSSVTPDDELESKRVKDPPLGKELLDGGAGLLRQAHGHIEKIFGLVTGPMDRAMSALEKTNERLQIRCDTLERDRDRVAQEREQLLSDATTRALAEKQMEGEERRKDEIFAILKQSAPELIRQVKASLVGGDPKVKEQIGAAIELLQSIKPDQLEALTMIDFLNPDQKKLVDQILKHRPDKAKAEGPAKAEESTKGT